MLISWLAMSLLKEISIDDGKNNLTPVELVSNDNPQPANKEITWEEIELDDELYDLALEIEFNDATFRVSDEYQTESNGTDDEFDFEIPDLIT